jgi:hypothetical protein
MWCIVQLLGIFQDAFDLGPECLKKVTLHQTRRNRDSKLAFLKPTNPFSLGEVILRSQSGKLCMIQTKTAENLANVAVGIDMSSPSTRSPWKSGNDSWSNEVANKKEVMVSALKHWKPR